MYSSSFAWAASSASWRVAPCDPKLLHCSTACGGAQHVTSALFFLRPHLLQHSHVGSGSLYTTTRASEAHKWWPFCTLFVPDFFFDVNVRTRWDAWVELRCAGSYQPAPSHPFYTRSSSALLPRLSYCSTDRSSLHVVLRELVVRCMNSKAIFGNRVFGCFLRYYPFWNENIRNFKLLFVRKGLKETVPNFFSQNTPFFFTKLKYFSH